jgi:hypothetical protein
VLASRSSDFGVILLAPPYRACAQWHLGAFVVRYSGATAQDFHLFPYSPRAVTRGTFQQKGFRKDLVSGDRFAKTAIKEPQRE